MDRCCPGSYRSRPACPFRSAKNWDALAALACILRRTNKRAVILDAGAEISSTILPSLFLYGYRSLVGINIDFGRPMNRGPIRYEPGDITRTQFPDSSVDAVTCLSVIEHGVDLSSYFREVARILKPGGIVITSADYFDTPIDPGGALAYGVPIRIFNREEILAGIEMAGSYGLDLTSPIDLACNEKAMVWEDFSLEYTFILFTLQKKNDGSLPGKHSPC